MMLITCEAYFTVILNFEMPVISDTHQTFCVHSFIIVRHIHQISLKPEDIRLKMVCVLD